MSGGQRRRRAIPLGCVLKLMISLDAAALAKLQEDVGGEPEIMRELIQTFLAEAPRVLEGMRNGLERRRLSELHRAAHSLKSTAATFGAGELSQLCRDLEQDTEKLFPEDAEPRVAAIEAEWARVRADLESWKPG